MKDSSKDVIDALVSNPKTQTFFVAFMATINTWWVEYGSWFTDMVTSLLILVSLVLVIAKNFLNIRSELRESKKRGVDE